MVPAQRFLTVTEPGGEPKLALTRENGALQLLLNGKQGARYSIQTSNALANWTDTAITVVITNQSGQATFSAPAASQGTQRFYRAVLR